MSDPVALPMPCLGCGAAMIPSEPSALHADPALRCGFCGRTEAMPRDAAERHRFLRLRLVQVRRAREAAEAPLEAQRMVRQAWTMGGLALVPLAGWQWYQVWTGAGPLASRLAAIAAGAASIAVLVGAVAMVRSFARWCAPILRARPPLAPGLAARCRTCGAPLPPIRGPSAACEHCGAANLLDDALARDAARLLAEERAAHERRARGGLAADPDAYLAPARAFYRGALGGGLAAVALQVILLAATGRLR